MPINEHALNNEFSDNGSCWFIIVSDKKNKPVPNKRSVLINELCA